MSLNFVLDVLKVVDLLEKVVEYQDIKIIRESDDTVIYEGRKKDFTDFESTLGFYVQHLSVSNDNELSIYIETTVSSTLDYNFDLISVIGVVSSEDEICVTDFVTSEEYYTGQSENLFEITPTELDFRDFPIARVYVRGNTLYADILSNVIAETRCSETIKNLL